MVNLKNDLSTPENIKKGISCLIDPGLPLGIFTDFVTSFHPFIDYVKFGWGTGIITPDISRKIDVLKKNEIDFWFGGTLFEIYYHKNNLTELIAWIKSKGTKYFEISDGALPIPLKKKLQLIEVVAKDFFVLSEVGSKDTTITMEPSDWINQIHSELDAGAWKIITEGRESGTAGIYQASGDIRIELIHAFLESDVALNEIIFEAPQKSQQIWLIKQFGKDVNLGNINFFDVLNLETLRQGLRSDTVEVNFQIKEENESISSCHTYA